MSSATATPHGKILLTGASGLIGRALAARLRAEGREVVELAHQPRPGALVWCPSRGEFPDDALSGVEAVVHLAGETIGQRWSDDAKKRIYESRTLSTLLLAERIAAAPPAQRPRAFISASAIGFYGAQRAETLDETAETGAGFLAEVSRAWEEAAKPAAEAGVRLVNARFGVVLSRHGGALEKLLKVFHAGMAGTVGPGTQRMSWISLGDIEEIMLFLLRHDELRGPVNIVAPQPCANKEMVELVARLLRKPAKVHAPAFMLKMMFGQMAEETMLSDLAVRPRRLQDAGYAWRHAELEAALRHELGTEIPPGT